MTPSFRNFPKDSQKISYSETGSPSAEPSGTLLGLFAISAIISKVLLTSCFLIVRTMRDSCNFVQVHHTQRLNFMHCIFGWMHGWHPNRQIWRCWISRSEKIPWGNVLPITLVHFKRSRWYDLPCPPIWKFWIKLHYANAGHFLLNCNGDQVQHYANAGLFLLNYISDKVQV